MLLSNLQCTRCRPVLLFHRPHGWFWAERFGGQWPYLTGCIAASAVLPLGALHALEGSARGPPAGWLTPLSYRQPRTFSKLVPLVLSSHSMFWLVLLSHWMDCIFLRTVPPLCIARCWSVLEADTLYPPAVWEAPVLLPIFAPHRWPLTRIRNRGKRHEGWDATSGGGQTTVHSQQKGVGHSIRPTRRRTEWAVLDHDRDSQVGAVLRAGSAAGHES